MDDMLLQQIVRQEGASPSSGPRYDDEIRILRPRATQILAVAPEGSFGLECGGGSDLFPLFCGVYNFLAIQAISELATLHELSFCAALAVSNAHSSDPAHYASLHEKMEVRAALLRTCTSLVKNNLMMASLHCGGRPLFRRFFEALRVIPFADFAKSHQELPLSIRKSTRLPRCERSCERA